LNHPPHPPPPLQLLPQLELEQLLEGVVEQLLELAVEQLLELVDEQLLGLVRVEQVPELVISEDLSHLVIVEQLLPPAQLLATHHGELLLPFNARLARLKITMIAIDSMTTKATAKMVAMLSDERESPGMLSEDEDKPTSTILGQKVISNFASVNGA
jgi:hypothetical protein